MAYDKFSVPTADLDGVGARQKMAQPKRKDHWRITFTGFGGEHDTQGNTNTGDGAKFITLDAQTVGLPQVSFEKHEVHSYNSKMHYKGKYTWNPIDVVFRDAIDSNAIKGLYEQLLKEFDHENQEARVSPATYKFTMVIQQLDGTQSNVENGEGVLSEWTCYGCLIENAQFGDGLDYTSSDFSTVSITVQPDTCEMSSVTTSDAKSM